MTNRVSVAASKLPKIVVWSLALAVWAWPSIAQDTLEVTLPMLEIQATRDFESTYSAARSVYVRNREDASIRPGMSLQRTLRGIPGIRITDRGHYGLGERVIVRGMGYRAAFGVRGVQTFLNGIPLTMADGQSMLDVVDPAFIDRAELLRGPSSMYWGNASGGVLFLSTEPDTSTIAVRYMGGSHGLMHAMGSASTEGRMWQLGAYASRVDQKGYRDHSDGGFLRIGASGQVRKGSIVFRGIFNMAMQDVNSPGSLTAEQFQDNPRQANSRFVTQRAGKKSEHILGGLSMQSNTPVGTLTATTYYMTRWVDNPLTYAWINLDRNAGGAYVQLHNSVGKFSWSAGGDYRRQHDHRQTFGNDAGVLRHDQIRLDQYETVSSLAAFATAQARLTDHIGLTAGARIDGINFQLSDEALSNGDQSGNRRFAALSHSVGGFFNASASTIYLNVSTSFESPTTTEFINSPTVEGQIKESSGLNPDLGPQRAAGIEVGVRRHVPLTGMLLDVAAYRMRIRDRLVPRQSEDGRTWYRNAGRNRHQGVEVAVTWPVGPALQTELAYTYSNFKFLSDPEQGLRVPGIPDHQIYGAIQTRIGRHWLIELTAEYASSVVANQENTSHIDGYAVLDLHFARDQWYIGRWRISSFARIQNLLDDSYSGSLIVNAFGGRYYEPSSRRAFQIGFGLAF